MRRLPQSTAYTVMLKLFLSSDHVSAATGKTVAIKISKAGVAFADPNAGASNATEVSNGWYKFALDTTDTATLGDLVVRGTSASCDDAEQVCQVVSATSGGATNLDAAVSAVKTKTDSLTFTVGGMVDSNVVDWKGATAPAMTGDAFARLGAPAGASVSADVAAVKVDTAAVKVQTDKITFTVTNQVDVNVLDWKSATAPAMTGDAFARIGAAGAGLTALGDTRIAHLDADTSSRMATFSYTAPDNSSITAIKGKTDNLPSDPADASDIAAAFTSLASHGDSNWATATGFSTSADITGAVSTLEGYGDTNWSTATGFSTIGAGDVWDVLLTDHEGAGSMGQSLFYAQQGATSADTKATDIFGDTQAIRSVTDNLVQTGGKLWVLDETGNPLPNTSDVSAIKTTTDKLDDTLEDNAGTFRFTAAGLAETPTGGSAPTAGEVAIAVWDEALSGHATDGTAGKALGDTVSMAGTIEGRIGTPTFGDLAGDIAHAQGVIDGIDTKTTNLPDDPADASVVAGAFAALQSHGDGAWATGATAPTVDAIADEVETRTLNANMTQINGTALTGDGSSGDKFGPA